MSDFTPLAHLDSDRPPTNIANFQDPPTEPIKTAAVYFAASTIKRTLFWALYNGGEEIEGKEALYTGRHLDPDEAVLIRAEHAEEFQRWHKKYMVYRPVSEAPWVQAYAEAYSRKPRDIPLYQWALIGASVQPDENSPHVTIPYKPKPTEEEELADTEPVSRVDVDLAQEKEQVVRSPRAFRASVGLLGDMDPASEERMALEMTDFLKDHIHSRDIHDMDTTSTIWDNVRDQGGSTASATVQSSIRNSDQEPQPPHQRLGQSSDPLSQSSQTPACQSPPLRCRFRSPR